MGLTSLLVCADAKTVQVLSRILMDTGMGVEHCSDHSLAMTLIEDQRFKIIFVDCQNAITGADLIANLRQDARTKDAILIAILENRIHLREVFAHGANFILFKPVSPPRMKDSASFARSGVRSERRLRPRVPVDANASIAYASTENEAIRVLDLSEDGIAIHSGKNLPRNCKVYFQFSLPGEAASVRLSSEVIWQDESRHVGLRFVDVPKSSRAILNRWIHTNVAGKLHVIQSSASPEESFSMDFLVARLGLVSAAPRERRQQARLNCSIGAEVYYAGSHVQQRCVVTDISEGGCYVQTTEPLHVGAEIEVVLRTEDVKLRMMGKVQSAHRGMGMGVHLKPMTVAHTRELQQLISKVDRFPATVTHF